MNLDHVTMAGPEQLIRGIRYAFGLAEVGIVLAAILAVVAMVIDRNRKPGIPTTSTKGKGERP